MIKIIKEKIFELADEKYQKFSSRLLPNIDNIIAVTLPALRKIAKTIAKEDWREFMGIIHNEYFEYLKNNSLNDFTYNNSLQKITESLQVDKETKAFIRSMKHR